MTSWLIRRLAKPEYFCRPGQLFRRALRSDFAGVPETAVVTMPWGFPLEIAPAETIGRGIWRLGVHELVVSEILWRLIDPGESVADIGANSGYFAGLMAARAGAGGMVSAFEPHHGMLERLERNAGLWRARSDAARILVHPVALSDAERVAELWLPPGYEVNTGTASIEERPAGARGGKSICVEARRMDALFPVDAAPAVMKVDVEGHEARVFAGAGDLLSPGGVRDIVFEEHRPYAAESMRLLERRGYTLFRLARAVLRPRLLPPDTPAEHRSWEAPNYLATLDAHRARERLGSAGWMCLAPGRRVPA